MLCCSFFTGKIINTNSQTSQELLKIYNKAQILPLPIPILDSTKYQLADGFYLKKGEINTLIQSGFKIALGHEKSDVHIGGKLNFNDNLKYMLIDIESVSQGSFGDDYLIIIGENNKIIEQFLLSSYGKNAPDESLYEILKNKTIQTKTITVIKTEKLAIDKYNPKTPKKRFYCKVISTQFQINNGKVVKIKESTPIYDYFIFNGESLEKQR